MLEIVAFVAIIGYVCTLPARVRRALGGEAPAKFKGDSARYRVALRRESGLIGACSALWAVKNIVDVAWLRTEAVAGGTALLLWVIIAGWVACAAGAFVARRSLTAAAGMPSPAAE